MRLQVVSNEEFSQVGANLIAAYFRPGEQTRISFAAGNTPLGAYAELVRRYQMGDLIVDSITAFTLDEYTQIPRTHPRSCFQSLTRHLYSGLSLSESQTQTYDDALEPGPAASVYEDLVMKDGGLDFAILGIGTNGHVGFNEPGTPFDSRTHVTKLAPATMARARQEGWMDAPPRGLTLGIGTLFDAQSVLLMANGLHKAEIVERIVNGDVSTDVPAMAFREHPNSLLLLDADAASRL